MSATARRILSMLLLAYGIYDLRDPGRGSVLAGVDLAIHETGHFVFGPFGEFLGFAGGTLLQLIMPIAFAVYFTRRGDQHAASVTLWWVHRNLRRGRYLLVVIATCWGLESARRSSASVPTAE